MSTPRKPQALSLADAQQLLLGVCPACNHTHFALGPGVHAESTFTQRNVVCIHCLREYNVSPIGYAEIIAFQCDDARLDEIYNIASRPIAGYPQA